MDAPNKRTALIFFFVFSGVFLAMADSPNNNIFYASKAVSFICLCLAIGLLHQNNDKS